MCKRIHEIAVKVNHALKTQTALVQLKECVCV